MKVFWHLGTTVPDYRSIMRQQGDFRIGEKLIPASQVVIAEQTHSALVHHCTQEDSGAGFGEHPQIAVADALITNVPEQYLLIRTADCTPVLLFDKQSRAVGAVHSGREGTRKNIVGRTVQQMQELFGVAAKDIIAYIGAGICAQHYEVDEQTWQEYNQSLLQQGFYPDPALRRKIDIRLGIFQQLIAGGVTFRNIEQICTCTYESAEHFSFRRDGSHNRQINLIGINYE